MYLFQGSSILLCCLVIYQAQTLEHSLHIRLHLRPAHALACIQCPWTMQLSCRPPKLFAVTPKPTEEKIQRRGCYGSRHKLPKNILETGPSPGLTGNSQFSIYRLSTTTQVCTARKIAHEKQGCTPPVRNPYPQAESPCRCFSLLLAMPTCAD